MLGPAMAAITEQEARRLWKEADAVCFDVDSTVIREEGCDELARFLGKAEEVAELTRLSMGGALDLRHAVRRTLAVLAPSRCDIVRFLGERRLRLSPAARTRRAMSGAMEFREALRLRLELLRPSHADVSRFTSQLPLNVSPGISELVQKLHSRGVKVFLVSGGFHCLIRPIAAALNIPAENITANKLLFDFFGNYAGFDESQPTSASGGKARALQRLIDEHKLRCLAMVGDGATDLEAAPPAHVFIGYGGNVVRPKVQEAAPWFVHHFQELIDALSESG
ncbi:phosphoserine phosphatase-like isoform X1 [Amphibalanus amphitrite]|uniref:phosphoserine phosphatase-like isoform X1 n=2 Tax=Amphibalanus amphitrite TaxID=1232801 RepID=UPI001C919CB4|nr:phosphoserine phosphatase-like isoform X1 [Amphibalanus amphitrite]